MLLRSLLLHNYVCRRLLFDAWWAFGCVGQKDVMRSHYKPVESHLFYEWERDWEVAADRLGAWWLFCASTHSEIIRIAFCVFCRALEIVERRRFIVISRKLSPSATVIIVIVIVIFALDCLCFNSMLDYYHFFFVYNVNVRFCAFDEWSTNTFIFIIFHTQTPYLEKRSVWLSYVCDGAAPGSLYFCYFLIFWHVLLHCCCALCPGRPAIFAHSQPKNRRGTWTSLFTNNSHTWRKFGTSFVVATPTVNCLCARAGIL